MRKVGLGHEASAAPSPRQNALVVGINDSPRSGLGHLTCAEHDAEQMREVLSSPACGFSVTLLCSDRATSANVQSAIIELIRAHQDPDDYLLFYFSGHGCYVGGDVYLVTSDFNPEDIEYIRDRHLSLRVLRQLLYERTQAGRVLRTLDCCYPGDLAGSGPDANLEDLFEQIRRYFTDNFAAPSKTTTAPSNALRWTLAAALANEPARDGTSPGSYSLLTGHILRALRGDVEKALDDDGRVRLENLVLYLR